MIAVDSNLLVYGHRQDSPWYEKSSQALRKLSQDSDAWALPWPCVHEFLAIVTHPRIYDPPTPVARAIDQVEAWLESPSLVLLAETGSYWSQLREAVKKGRIRGAQVHDARVVALCQHHGVRELWTADRDFTRFKSLSVRNPLVD